MFLFQTTKASTGQAGSAKADLERLNSIAGIQQKRTGFFFDANATAYPGAVVMPPPSKSMSIISSMQYVEAQRLFILASDKATARDGMAAKATAGSSEKKNALAEAACYRQAAALIANNFWEEILARYDKDHDVKKAWDGLAKGDGGREFLTNMMNMREIAVGRYLSGYASELWQGLKDYSNSAYGRAVERLPAAFAMPQPGTGGAVVASVVATDIFHGVINAATNNGSLYNGKFSDFWPIAKESAKGLWKFSKDLFVPYFNSREDYTAARETVFQVPIPESVERLAKQFTTTSIDAIFTISIVGGFVAGASRKVGLNLVRFAAIDARTNQLVKAGVAAERAAETAKFEVDAAIAGRAFKSENELTAFLNKKFKINVSTPAVAKELTQVLEDATRALAIKRYGAASETAMESARNEIKRILLRQADKEKILKPGEMRKYLEDEFNKLPGMPNIEIKVTTTRQFASNAAGYYAKKMINGVDKAKTNIQRGVGIAGIYVGNGIAYISKDAGCAFVDGWRYLRLTLGNDYVSSLSDLRKQALSIVAERLPGDAGAIREVNALFKPAEKSIADLASAEFEKICPTPLASLNKPLAAVAREMLDMRIGQLVKKGVAEDKAVGQALGEIKDIFAAARGNVVKDIEESMGGILRDSRFGFAAGDNSIWDVEVMMRGYKKSASYMKWEAKLPAMPVGKAIDKQAMDEIQREFQEIKAGWWAGLGDIGSAFKPALLNGMFKSTAIKIDEKKAGFLAKYNKALENAEDILKGKAVGESAAKKLFGKAKTSRLSQDLWAEMTRQYNELKGLMAQRSEAIDEGRTAKADLNRLMGSGAASDASHGIADARDILGRSTARIEDLNKTIDARIDAMEHVALADAEITARTEFIKEIRKANSYQGGIALLDDAAQGVAFSKEFVKAYAVSKTFSHIRTQAGRVKFKNALLPYSADFKAEQQVISGLTSQVKEVQQLYREWLGLQESIEAGETQLAALERKISAAETKIAMAKNQRVTVPGTDASALDHLRADKLLLEKQLFSHRAAQAGVCAKTAIYWTGAGLAGGLAFEAGAASVAQFAGAYGIWAMYSMLPELKLVPVVALPFKEAKSGRRDLSRRTGPILLVADKAVAIEGLLKNEEKEILAGIVPVKSLGITAIVDGKPLSLENAFMNSLNVLREGKGKTEADLLAEDALNTQRVLAHLQSKKLTVPNEAMVLELDNVSQGRSEVPGLRQREASQGTAPVEQQAPAPKQTQAEAGGKLAWADVALSKEDLANNNIKPLLSDAALQERFIAKVNLLMKQKRSKEQAIIDELDLVRKYGKDILR